MYLSKPSSIKLYAPLSPAELAKVNANCGEVSIAHSDQFTDLELEAIAAVLRKQPQTKLKIWGGTQSDLEVLKFFTDVRRLFIDANDLLNIDGLHHVASSVAELELKFTARTSNSLKVLRNFERLKLLRLKNFVNDLDVVSELVGLETLAIEWMKQFPVEFITKLPALKSIELIDSSLTSYEPLRDLADLQNLDLALVDRFKETAVLPELHSLQKLQLRDLNLVVALPDFAQATKLRRVSLIGFKKLKDITGLSYAPHLEDLVVGGTPNLYPINFQSFAGHPTLKHVWTDLGPEKDVKVKEIVGRPSAGARSEFVFLEP